MMKTARTTAEFAKQMDAFEALWARYIDALDALDAVKDHIAENRRRSLFGSRIYRTKRMRRLAADRLAARLFNDYDVVCCAPAAREEGTI